MPRKEGSHDPLSSTGSHVGGEGAPRHDGPGVGVRSDLLRIGGTFNTGTGIAQAPGIPLGGCSRGWGRSHKPLVLPVEELVGLSGGRPKAPEQPAVDKAGSCRWRRGLGSGGGVLGIQTVVAWGNGVFPFLRLRKTNSNQHCPLSLLYRRTQPWFPDQYQIIK